MAWTIYYICIVGLVSLRSSFAWDEMISCVSHLTSHHFSIYVLCRSSRHVAIAPAVAVASVIGCYSSVKETKKAPCDSWAFRGSRWSFFALTTRRSVLRSSETNPGLGLRKLWDFFPSPSRRVIDNHSTTWRICWGSARIRELERPEQGSNLICNLFLGLAIV